MLLWFKFSWNIQNKWYNFTAKAMAITRGFLGGHDTRLASSRVKCLIFHPFLRHFSWEWNNCHLLLVFVCCCRTTLHFLGSGGGVCHAKTETHQSLAVAEFTFPAIYWSISWWKSAADLFPPLLRVLLQAWPQISGLPKSIRNWCEKRNETGITRNTHSKVKTQMWWRTKEEQRTNMCNSISIKKFVSNSWPWNAKLWK